MVFSSITFLFYFLPAFLLLYFMTPFKNIVLLVSSLLFYAWGEVSYTLVLMFSIVINYFFGLVIDRYKTNNENQKLYLALGVFINLLILGYFKYFNFFINKILGIDDLKEIHLPLGISFFTFQAISYLLDVYRKQAKVESNLFNLALYISMFPQLIAGPIVRFKTVVEQIHHRHHELEKISAGIKIFMIGLAQKVLIANTMAEPVDTIFALEQVSLTTAVAWLGAICYSFQIYFDFAGYSHMAIGLGLIMGLSFPKNFNYPYISQSITEFWRRWHISLSSWFRDYLYIPLGGNRYGALSTYRNLMIVFLLCGLWHGAAWSFIIWGMYHGVFLIVERLFLSSVLKQSWRPLRHTYTIIVVLIGWVIFRSEDLDQLQFFLYAMIGLNEGKTIIHVLDSYLNNTLIVTSIFAILFSTPLYLLLKKSMIGNFHHKKNIKALIINLLSEVFILLMFLLSLMTVASGSYNPFIYFRF